MKHLLSLEDRFQRYVHEAIVKNFFKTKIGKKIPLIIFLGPIFFLPQVADAWAVGGRWSMLILWIFFSIANPLAYTLIPQGKSPALRWLYIIYTSVMLPTLVGEILGFF